ncbi:unnamed protein product [Ectocarpus sp. 12 AP-2014]
MLIGTGMFTSLKWLPMLLVCLLVSACASSVTPPARYMLTSNQLPIASTQPEGTLRLSAPRLAHYLDVEGIVMQLDDITLNAAREHQWAEGLGRQLERGLRARLSQTLPSLRVVRAEGSQADALTLRIEVDQFQGRFDGLAIARGQWQLVSAEGELLAMENFHAETTLDEDGYPALVRALSTSWDKAAELIANEIRLGAYFD